MTPPHNPRDPYVTVTFGTTASGARKLAERLRALGLSESYEDIAAANLLMALDEQGATTQGGSMGLTTDPNDPRLGHGVGGEGMNEAYLVLSEDERAKGFVRPVRRTYVHEECGVATTMGQAVAETYARNPSFYGATYCVGCRTHKPVGPRGEFVWDDGSKVGS
jgi:hypothetical protein